MVAPLLHRYEADSDAVKVTLPPGQKDNGPLAVMVGTGRLLINTLVGAEVREHPLALVTVTV